MITSGISYRLSALGEDVLPSHCIYLGGIPDEGCWAFGSLETAVLASIYSHTQEGVYRPNEGFMHLQLLRGPYVTYSYDTGWRICTPASMEVVEVETIHEMLAWHLGCNADELEDESVSKVSEALEVLADEIRQSARPITIRLVDVLGDRAFRRQGD